MVAEEERGSHAREVALRAEIAVLRGTVSALRATRASAVMAAQRDTEKHRARARVAVAIAAFLAGVIVTLGSVEIVRAAICP